jgi:hypothetical protein
MRLVLLIAAAVIVGCGSSDGADWVDEATKAEAVVTEALNDLGSESGELEASSKAIAGAARHLDAAEPPDDAKDVDQHLVAGLRKLAATLHQAAEAGRKGDFAKRDDLLEHLDTSPGLRELEAAANA